MSNGVTMSTPRRRSPRCLCPNVRRKAGGHRIVYRARLHHAAHGADEMHPVLSCLSRIGLAEAQSAAAEADLPRPLPARGTEHSVEPDEFAIYGWINPTKVPEAVIQERRRIVALQAIRY